MADIGVEGRKATLTLSATSRFARTTLLNMCLTRSRPTRSAHNSR